MKKQTYIVKDLISETFKIGVTSDIKKRLKCIKTYTPKSELISLINDDIEKDLHFVFKDKLIDNEWYELNEDDLYLIKYYSNIIDTLCINKFHITRIKKYDLFNANKLIKYINEKRKDLNLIEFNIYQYCRNVKVKNFLCQFDKTHLVKNGKGAGASSATFISFELLSDILFSELCIYEDVNDFWIKKRLFELMYNKEESSYSKMAGALYETSTDKARFHKEIKNIASVIKKALNVDDWNSTTQDKLKQRDEIHNNIALLCKVMRDRNQIVRLAIQEVVN